MVKVLTSVTILSCLFCSVGHGGVEGHGGGVFVCRDSKGHIKPDKLAVELLDVWEATHVYHLKLERSNEGTQEQIDHAMNRLDRWAPEVAAEARFYMNRMLFSYDTQDDQAVIAPPSDTRAGRLKKGCPLEGVATYYDFSESIVMSPEIAAAMSKTDLAAFHVHESVCRALRGLWHQEDTSSCRRIVAYLFSTETERQLRPDLSFGKDRLFCKTDSGHFSFWILSSDQVHKIVFTAIDGNPMTASIPYEIQSGEWNYFFAQGVRGLGISAGHSRPKTLTQRPNRRTEDYQFVNVDTGHERFLTTFHWGFPGYPQVSCSPPPPWINSTELF